jgi:outer membrane lipoprotein-sorting protein
MPPTHTLETAAVRSLAAGLSLLLLLTLAPPAAGAGADSLSADDILNRVDDLYRGESSHGTMTMDITTQHWKRSLTLEFWTEGKEKSLVRILEPEKEKGTATLRVGNDMWNYLPKVNRVIKLPSSMMSSSWMGSHFTNNDLVKESRFTDDYTFEITFRGERDGAKIVEITCEPKPEAAVVWGRVIAVVNREDLLPIRLEYYDEGLDLARTMTFSDVRDLGGRRVPAVLEVQPADKPKESTVVTYRKVDFGVKLDDQVFSIRNLQR